MVFLVIVASFVLFRIWTSIPGFKTTIRIFRLVGSVHVWAAPTNWRPWLRGITRIFIESVIIHTTRTFPSTSAYHSSFSVEDALLIIIWYWIIRKDVTCYLMVYHILYQHLIQPTNEKMGELSMKREW